MNKGVEGMSHMTGNLGENATKGYDPVTGVPIGCLSSKFNWSASVRGEDAELYARVLGIDMEIAKRIISIQMTDPRERTEEEWALLDSFRPKA